MRAYGDAQAPVWITELSWPGRQGQGRPSVRLRDDAVRAGQAAEGGLRSLAKQRRQAPTIERVFWYTWLTAEDRSSSFELVGPAAPARRHDRLVAGTAGLPERRRLLEGCAKAARPTPSAAPSRISASTARAVRSQVKPLARASPAARSRARSAAVAQQLRERRAIASPVGATSRRRRPQVSGQRRGVGGDHRASRSPSPPAPAGRSPRRATAARTPRRRRRGRAAARRRRGRAAAARRGRPRRELRPMAARRRRRSIPSRGAAPARRGPARARFLRAVWRGDAEHVRALEAQRAARGLGIGVRREARRPRRPGPRRGRSTPSSSPSSPRENSDTVITRRARRASSGSTRALPGRVGAASTSRDGAAPPRRGSRRTLRGLAQRRQVRGAQQRARARRARTGSTSCSHAWPARCTSAGGGASTA